MTAASVRLEALRKTFGELAAVRSLDLKIPGGSFFSIIGPSGCGKTTTLRLIAGLELPDAGRILVSDQEVTRTPAYAREVNTVFQSYALFPHLDVAANIAFGLVEERRPKAEIQRRVGEMLDLVQLRGREHDRPKQLSGGQQQRVALARALVKQPKVLLLDEPLGALDLKLRKELQGHLRSVQRRVGITFVYVTHDQEEAFSMSDRIAVMNGGILEQVGTPEEIYRSPTTMFVADFVGEANRIPGTVRAARNGVYAVRLDAGEELEVGGPPGLAPGSRVTVLIRPEQVRLGPDGASDGYSGRVTDTSFMGSVWHLQLELERLGPFIATLPGSRAAVAAGTAVRVAFEPDGAWVVG